MTGTLRSTLLPENQRRTLDELTADLDMNHGDIHAKRTAFWTMLTLSAVIAAAGVLADSTATVIGAMIIAPLSTPIMGIALAIVKQERIASLRFVVLGGLLVVAVGAAFSLVVPGAYSLVANPQIAGRTSPSLLDLVGAVATGLAGAIALARRDVAAVLPGVAIAISLVPPLAVVGVCLSQGELALAGGALALFLSNLVALVLAGTLTFSVIGFIELRAAGVVGVRRRSRLALAMIAVVVTLPLLANTVSTYLVSMYTARVEESATEWIAEVPGAEVVGVHGALHEVEVMVQTPDELPPTDALVDSLRGRIPAGVQIVVHTELGERIEAGSVR